MKKKLMVVVGAGASIELGMPSVNKIDELFSLWAKDSYTLADNPDKTLYCYLKETVNAHYQLNIKRELRKETNFEELLYVMLNLAASFGDDNYDLPFNAFLKINEFPKISTPYGEKAVDGNDLRHLCFRLIDKLAIEFRKKCNKSANSKKLKKSTKFRAFRKFINRLNDEYDVAFITLNYDNLITQVCPDLFTGFDKSSGDFDPTSVYTRKQWGNLIYHLHGSIHFDMHSDTFDMHAIKWNYDLTSQFGTNSMGRNSQDTSEGIEAPTSTIIAGYGKTNQIQRVPFRTYYSKIDELVSQAEAYLFLGYGFNDLHLNNSFHSIRKGTPKKQVVVIDYALDNEDPLRFRHDNWSYNLFRSLKVDAPKMATRLHIHTPDIDELKAQNKFEVSRDPNYPLSVWHGGFIKACKHYDKVRFELENPIQSKD